ncbi:hypothetical protein B0H14DRAFT_1384758 [Mycena olivaceomarginata]|nr:hypothetical protein B0H14DRAFT_1384758 [Mycena olivaceomarginata]
MTVFFVALSAGMYWAVIYGIVAALFNHPIHWTVGHAIAVGIVGLLVQMLIGLGTVALSMTYGAQLRKIYNNMRVPRFYKGLFRSSDWSWRSMVNICLFTGILFLSPIGATVMLTCEFRVVRVGEFIWLTHLLSTPLAQHGML